MRVNFISANYKVKLIILIGILIVVGFAFWAYGQSLINKQHSSMTGQVITDQKQVSATYEWRDFRDLDPSSYKAKLSHLRTLGFNTIYLSLNPYVDIADSTDAAKTGQQIAYKEKLSEFIRMCKATGFNVSGLAGAQSWANPDKAYLNTYILDLIHQFNQSYPSLSMDRVQYDIESYNLPEYQTNKAQVLQEYLSTVKTLFDYGKQIDGTGNKVSIGFAIPYWFDKQNLNTVQVTFDGSTKYPMYHVVDLADQANGFVVVMAYRNQLEGSDGTLSLLENTAAYTQTKRGVTFLIAQEISDVTPVKITYHALGEAALIVNMNKLNDYYKGYASYRGIVVNDFLSLN